MGDPKKIKKQFEGPRMPWTRERIETEKELKKKYGLHNHREIWRMKTLLGKKRESARKILALPLEERLKREKEIVDSLFTVGLLPKDAALDDVLSLTTDAIMERRLQTVVVRQGLANTPMQARQFITHGHISIRGQRITSPSYIVRRDDEKAIGYYGKKMELTPKVIEKKEIKSAREELKEKFEEVKEAAENLQQKGELNE